MKFNVQALQKQMKKHIEKIIGDRVTFKYEIVDDVLDLRASINLQNHSDDIFMKIRIGDGVVYTYLTFDKADATPEMYNLINEYNDNQLYFRAYITEKGYLVLDHLYGLVSPDSIEDIVDDFIMKVGKLSDDESLQRITNLTHE